MAFEKPESAAENAPTDKFEEENEVKKYLDARYVSSIEACWRIFGFPLHQQFPSTQRLQIHLEDQQNIRFKDSDKVSDVVTKKDHTQLTAYFKLNDSEGDTETKSLKYHELPKFYCWNKDTKEWDKRKKYF